MTKVAWRGREAMSEAMSEAMTAEFDTVASWTADVALDLGPEYHVVAGCRGSGTPAALRWLLDRLAVSPGERLLDAGAGVGGPAAFAAQEAGAIPLLTEPEAGACDAARRLFGLPVVRAGSRLPLADESVDLAWCLGVLCTVPDQNELVGELHRVLAPQGRLGLLVFAAHSDPLTDPPEGNSFPTEPRLFDLLDRAGFVVEASAALTHFAGLPPGWAEQAQTVEEELARRHGDSPDWQTAGEQSAEIGRLLENGELVGTLLAARRPS